MTCCSVVILIWRETLFCSPCQVGGTVSSGRLTSGMVRVSNDQAQAQLSVTVFDKRIVTGNLGRGGGARGKLPAEPHIIIRFRVSAEER